MEETVEIEMIRERIREIVEKLEKEKLPKLEIGYHGFKLDDDLLEQIIQKLIEICDYDDDYEIYLTVEKGIVIRIYYNRGNWISEYSLPELLVIAKQKAKEFNKQKLREAVSQLLASI
jgi:hypothetical protein